MKIGYLFLLSVLFFLPLFGDVINVPGDQATIQAGIDAAVNGDTVLVAENIYYENIHFKGKAITVASYFILDGDTSHISKTVIDGSQSSNTDSGSVVYFISGEDTTSVLCGFTITGGTGTEFTPPDLSTFRYGGGIYINGNNSARIEWNTIENNTINSNYYSGGGGIFAGDPGGLGYTIIDHNTIRNNEVSGLNGSKEGCGIWMGSNGRIEDNIISSNSSLAENEYSIGAIRLMSGSDFPISEVYVARNTIINNTAVSEKSWAAAGGLNSSGTVLYLVGNRIERNTLTSPVECLAAGVHVASQPSRSKIEDNIINGNTMTISDSHEYKGGGLFLWESKTSVYNNTISDNYAGYGGGIFMNNSNPDILNNIVTNNSVRYSGGGIECFETSNPVITNNLIAYNTAGQDAGGIDIYNNSHPSLINNTIVENKADYGGAMAFNINCNPVITNTIVYGNNADSSGSQIWFWDDNSDPTITYCDIQGGSDAFGFYNTGYSYTGAYKNNIDIDPLFVDDSLFYLSTTSPCIDAGNPDPAYNDPDGTRNDMGAYGGPFVTAIEVPGKTVHQRPTEFILFQNYPNPFNPKTAIRYQLSAFSQVDLSIYNVLGQRITTLVSEKQKAGQYEVQWDASNVSSGIYFYILKTHNGMVQTKKMIVLR